MEEKAVILRRFGDEESTLLDRFERLSFEVQLNQAILGRSLSEPSLAARTTLLPPLPPPPALQHQGGQRRRHCIRGLGFQKVLKKYLLNPILGRNNKGGGRRRTDHIINPHPKEPSFFPWKKTFSRSLRV